jgi:hypothetical protein
MRLITRAIEVEVEVEGVKVKGRILGTSEQDAIRQKNYKLVDDRMTLDAAGFGKDLFCKMITGLSDNAVDMDGKKLPFNEKTLTDIYEFNNDFAQKVAGKITKAINEMREGELKNSKPGVSGTLPQAAPVAKIAKGLN